MKILTILFVLLSTTALFGQNWDQKFEDAAFESKDGLEAFYTTTITITSSFNQDIYNSISNQFIEKDGIANMHLEQNDTTIKVYHKGYIIFETFKSLLNAASETLTYELSEPKRFLF